MIVYHGGTGSPTPSACINMQNRTSFSLFTNNSKLIRLFQTFFVLLQLHLPATAKRAACEAEHYTLECVTDALTLRSVLRDRYCLKSKKKAKE